uniref:Uncharacterized protein n=1 Tax=Caenorhabditis japonica TaxID=281687 RepID=A0A8R1IFZ9_CAEJA
MLSLKEELDLGSEQFAIAAMITPGLPAKDLQTGRPAQLDSTRAKEDEWRKQCGGPEEEPHQLRQKISRHSIHSPSAVKTPSIGERGRGEYAEKHTRGTGEAPISDAERVQNKDRKPGDNTSAKK